MTVDEHESAPEEHLSARLRRAYADEVDRTHTSLLVAWIAFGVTFGLLRALTWAIHHGVGQSDRDELVDQP